MSEKESLQFAFFAKFKKILITHFAFSIFWKFLKPTAYSFFTMANLVIARFEKQCLQFSKCKKSIAYSCFNFAYCAHFQNIYRLLICKFAICCKKLFLTHFLNFVQNFKASLTHFCTMANLVTATFEKESLQVSQKAKTIPYSFFTIYSFIPML